MSILFFFGSIFFHEEINRFFLFRFIVFSNRFQCKVFVPRVVICALGKLMASGRGWVAWPVVAATSASQPRRRFFFSFFLGEKVW